MKESQLEAGQVQPERLNPIIELPDDVVTIALAYTRVQIVSWPLNSHIGRSHSHASLAVVSTINVSR